METTQEKERTKQAATVIVDNIIDLQMALNWKFDLQAMRLMRNIQDQARSLISGSDPADGAPTGLIGQGYRQDVLAVLQGLTETLCCESAATAEDGWTDDELHMIALAAETAHNRINNYLLVKRAENLMRRRDGVDRPAA